MIFETRRKYGIQKVIWYNVTSAEKQDQSAGIQHKKEIPSVKKQAESFYNSGNFLPEIFGALSTDYCRRSLRVFVSRSIWRCW